MIQVYLCDDNDILLAKYQKLIAEVSERNTLSVGIKTFSSGEQLLFHLEDDPNNADIIFLDVLMDKLDGMETAKQLRKMGCLSEIVFLTSSEKYVFDSFDVGAMHYILKERADTQLVDVFLQAVSLSQKKAHDVFTCENGGISKRIPLASISFFEVRNRIITVHFDNITFDFYGKLERLEQELEEHSFVRSHRSFLINLGQIDEIYKNYVKLLDGEEVPIGPLYLKPLKLAFSTYLASTF